MEEKKNHPKVEVSFAPTRAFSAKYGMAESEKQRKLFERPTWASLQIPDVPKTCETEHKKAGAKKKVLLEPEPSQYDPLLLVTSFALGLVCGIVLVWHNRFPIH